MPWGAIAGAALAAQMQGGKAQTASLRSFSARRRAERMARKRWLRKARPALIAIGCVLGLWVGYEVLMWILWWNPHPTNLINTSYP